MLVRIATVVDVVVAHAVIVELAPAVCVREGEEETKKGMNSMENK